MSINVAVVGLGKVGLPLAVQYASKGAKVIGCDINESVVAEVNAGRTPIKEEAFLAERLAAAVAAGQLSATTDTPAAVRQSNYVVVIVPLMVSADHQIDFRIIDSATRAVAEGLQPGTTVIYETTLPVGTSRERFAPMLAAGSGLLVGTDFSVVFSPERIRTGRIFRDLAAYPKVVGGIDATSTARGVAFYEAVLDAPVLEVSTAEAAEYTKLIETTYRDVNIALANEFATFAERRGIDVSEAIAAANSQQQSHIHEPGVGVGGHCIPVYPYFLLNATAPGELKLPAAGRAINDDMASHAAQRLSLALGGLAGRRIAILGLAYRADVKEAAYSTSLRLLQALEAAGATVVVNDPLFSDAEISARGATPVSLDDLGPVDAIIVQAYHQAYRELPASFFQRARVLLDGRGDLAALVPELGATTYLRIGAPAVEGVDVNTTAATSGVA